MSKILPVFDKRYIQTSNFWCDNHNKRMFELSQKLSEQRDLLSSIAKAEPNRISQKIDGSLEFVNHINTTKGVSAIRIIFAKDMNEVYHNLQQEISKYCNGIFQ